MKRATLAALATLATLAFGLAAPATRADESHDVTAGKALVKSSACFTCHAVQGTKVGPGFADIAAKYAGKSDAQKLLMDEIEHGIKGTAMPANTALSDAERDQIVDWILSLKK